MKLILSDGTNTVSMPGANYLYHAGTLQARREPRYHEGGSPRQDGVRVSGRNWDAVRVSFRVTVSGSSVDDAIGKYGVLQTILRNATTFATRRWGRQATLQVQADGSTNAVTFDVLTGDVPDLWDHHPRVTNFYEVAVELICRPFGRTSEAQLLAATTLTNHDDAGHNNYASISGAGVTGDALAEAKLWFENNDADALTYGALRFGCFADLRAIGSTPAPVVEAEGAVEYGQGTITTLADATCSDGNQIRIGLYSYGAFYPDGTRYAYVADAAWQDLGTAFTLECFVYLDAAAGNAPQALISKWNSTGSQKSYALLVEQKKLRFVMSADGANVDLDVRGTTTLSTQTWYWCHVEYAVSDGKRYGWIYLNGTLEAQNNSDVPTTLTTYDPNAAGTYDQWAKTGGGDAYTILSDNSDSSYISTGTINQRTSVNVADVAAGTYQKIVVRARVRSGIAGEGTDLAAFLRHGGADYDGASQAVALATYAWFEWTWWKDPSDNTAWTEADLDAIEIGVRKTISINSARVSELEMQVYTYTASEEYPFPGTAELRIGAFHGWAAGDSIDGVTAAVTLDGRVDEVRISTSQVSASRATPTVELSGGAALYHCNDDSASTTMADSSGNGRDASLTPGAGWASGYFTAAGAESLRLVLVVPEVLCEAFAGWYDVYARVRATADDVDDVSWRARWENGPWWTQDQKKVAATGIWQMRWLGRVKLPWFVVQDAWIGDDVFGTATYRRFQLYSTHAAVGDSLELDYFLFLPTEPFSGVIRSLEAGQGQGVVVSAIDDQPWVGQTGTTYPATRPPESLDPQVVVPYLHPGITHYVVANWDRSDGSNDISDELDVTVRYMPRWLWLR